MGKVRLGAVSYTHLDVYKRQLRTLLAANIDVTTPVRDERTNIYYTFKIGVHFTGTHQTPFI